MSWAARYVKVAKVLTTVALVALVSAKAIFHDWVCATLRPRHGDSVVMKVRHVPCRTGADLQPGHTKVYARCYGIVKYFEFKFGRSDYRKALIPLIPPRITSPYVILTGNLVSVGKVGIKAPFKVIVLKGNPRVHVNQYEIKISGPCKVVLEPSTLKFFPPLFVINGRGTRCPNNVHCRNVAVIMPYNVPSAPGRISFAPVASVVSASATAGELKVNTTSIYAPKGITIRWEPFDVLLWTSYVDIVWRWPYWPYSL